MWPGACVMARGSLACMTAVCGVTPHLFGVARPGLGVTQVSGDIQLLPALFVCRRAGRAWPKARTLCRSCSHTLCACGDHRRGKATCKARKWQAAAAAAGGGGRDAQKTGISSSLMSTPSPKSGCKLQSRVSAAMPSTYAGQAPRRHGTAAQLCHCTPPHNTRAMHTSLHMALFPGTHRPAAARHKRSRLWRKHAGRAGGGREAGSMQHSRGCQTHTPPHGDGDAGTCGSPAWIGPPWDRG